MAVDVNCFIQEKTTIGMCHLFTPKICVKSPVCFPYICPNFNFDKFCVRSNLYYQVVFLLSFHWLSAQQCNDAVWRNRPFYSCVLSSQAFDLEWGWRWPCCDRDQYLVSMIIKKFAFEKQQGLYHNKVYLNLTPVQRLGNQAHNCKMDYSWTNKKESILWCSD